METQKCQSAVPDGVPRSRLQAKLYENDAHPAGVTVLTLRDRVACVVVGCNKANGYVLTNMACQGTWFCPGFWNCIYESDWILSNYY